MAAVTLNVLANTRPLRRELKRARQAWRTFKNDVNEAGGGLRGVQAGLGGLVRSAGGLAVVGTAAAGALGAIGVAAFRAADNYDRAVKSIVAATGASGASLDALVANTDAVFRTTAASYRTVADVVGVVATAFSNEARPAVEAASKAIIDIADVSGVAVEQISDATVRVARLFELTSDELDKLGDVVVAVGQEYGTTTDGILTAVQRLGPNLKALGLDAFAALDFAGQVDKIGIPVRRLNSVIEAFISRAIASGRDLREVWDEVTERVEAQVTSTQKLAVANEYVTGTYAPVLAQLIDLNVRLREGDDVLSEYRGTLEETEEAVDALGDKMKEFQNEVALPLGNAMKFLLERFIDFALGVREGIDDIGADLNRLGGNLVHWVSNVGRAVGIQDLVGLFGGDDEGGAPSGGPLPFEPGLGVPPVSAANFPHIAGADTAERVRAGRFAGEQAARTAFNLANDRLTSIIQQVEGRTLDPLVASGYLREIERQGLGEVSREAGERADDYYRVGRLAELDPRIDLLQAQIGAGFALPGADQQLVDLLTEALQVAGGSTIEGARYAGELTTAEAALTGGPDVPGGSGSASRAASSIDTLGGAASSAATALTGAADQITAATVEVERFADGIIILNDGIQTWEPDLVVNRQAVGNSVLTSLERRATASTATGGTDGGARDSASLLLP